MSKWPNEQLRPVNVVNKGSAAYLEWKPPKGDSRLAKYVIYKSSTYDWEDKCEKLDEEGEFQDLEVIELDPSTTQWEDTGNRPKSRYSYYIFGVDEKGNHHFPSYQYGKVKS